MSRDLTTLEPATLAMIQKVIAAEAVAGNTLVPIQTYRTFAEQSALYAKGRTAPGVPCHHSGVTRPVGTCDIHPLGATVTRARAGLSPHNWGCAVDCWFMIDGTTTDDVPGALWTAYGDTGKSMGMVWGGDFPGLPDLDHLENPQWREIAAQANWQEIAPMPGA